MILLSTPIIMILGSSPSSRTTTAFYTDIEEDLGVFLKCCSLYIYYLGAVPRATAWSTGDWRHMYSLYIYVSNYFTMYSYQIGTTNWEYTCTVCCQKQCTLPCTFYKIVAVLAFRLSLLLFKRLQIGSTCVLFVATPCVLFVATTIRVSENSVSVYYFYYYILKLYLPLCSRMTHCQGH